MATKDPEIDDDTEVAEEMIAGLTRHIFGAGEQGIIARLKEGASDLGNTIGTLTYTMVEEGARQAAEAGKQFDQETLLEVASKIIDDLLEMSEAIGLIDNADDDVLREDAMMAAMQAYAMNNESSPDQQEAAAQQLAMMQEDGTYDEGIATIAEMGKRRGIDPFADDQPPPGAGQPVDAAQGGGQPAPQPGSRPQLIGG